MRISQISAALRQEKRERFEAILREQESAAYRDYVAEKCSVPEDRRNDVTGY